MQLVELGHSATGAGGVSGRLPAEGNAAVKGLLHGGHADGSRTDLCLNLPVPPWSCTQLKPPVVQCTALLHSRVTPGCSPPKRPWLAEEQKDVPRGEAFLSSGATSALGSACFLHSPQPPGLVSLSLFPVPQQTTAMSGMLCMDFPG